MPGGVAAMPVTKRGNFNTKYPRVLPQTCRGATDVCAHILTPPPHLTHTRARAHFFAYADASGSSAFTADLAQSQELPHSVPGSKHTQAHSGKFLLIRSLFSCHYQETCLIPHYFTLWYWRIYCSLQFCSRP